MKTEKIIERLEHCLRTENDSIVVGRVQQFLDDLERYLTERNVVNVSCEQEVTS